MTGPQHYAEAEKHLAASAWQRQKWGEHDRKDGDQLAEDLLDSALWEARMAQAHATLALAAATIQPHLTAGNLTEPEQETWLEAIWS